MAIQSVIGSPLWRHLGGGCKIIETSSDICDKHHSSNIMTRYSSLAGIHSSRHCRIRSFVFAAIHITRILVFRHRRNPFISSIQFICSRLRRKHCWLQLEKRNRCNSC